MSENENVRQVHWYQDLIPITNWVRANGGRMTYGQVDAIRGVPRAENPAAAVYNDAVDPAAAHGLLLDGLGVRFVAIHDTVVRRDDGTFTATRPDGSPCPLAYKP